MHIVNIYLPQVNNAGIAFNEAIYLRIRTELIQKFGGLTQYDQVPAIGYWKENADKPISKDLVIHYEVICNRLTKKYWADFRLQMEKTFEQTQILIVAHPILAL
ncbi:MAG: hypothetical protein CTY33_07605 [Methylotenera sp.]|nr:MAG: hypothetical protein CTY33_07605 [Methylotenera sp.]